jgi:hypothetical protein
LKKGDDYLTHAMLNGAETVKKTCTPDILYLHGDSLYASTYLSPENCSPCIE